MTDQERQDHWALLASRLGAPPSEEKKDESQPAPVEPPASEEPAARIPEGPRYSFTRPESQRSSTDWLQLAERLGVPVDAETASQATEETTSTEVVEPQAPPAVPPAPPAVVMESLETEVDVVDVFSEGDQKFGESLVEHVDTDAVEEARPERKRRRKRRRRRSRKPEDTQEVSETPGLPTCEEVDFGEDEAEEEPAAPVGNSESLIVSPMEPPPAEAPSRGRRRRRRRGSGRKKTQGEAVEASAEDSVDESLTSIGREDEDTEAAFEESVREPSRGELYDDDRLDETDDEAGERLVHRGIPTWEEAVGIVVNHNMEARAKNPGGQQRSRGNRNRN